MPEKTATKHCTSPPAKRGVTMPLTVLADHPSGIRKSKSGPRRAAVLIGVHLLVAAHLLHWWWKGRTLSPVEPSEAMYTLNKGELNAGFIFFALAILSTLILGRFFCGWGCHLVAYQDFCGWLMKKIGVKPKPFRSRLLVLAPLALAIYMFIWPTVYRWFAGAPAPALTNHMTTAQFWKTFPGLVVAIITFAICGFAIVYVLGAKGFCTYACPYGGFFGLADQVAPGRILVTTDCEQCGHCTAVCTSNVRVHEEVAKFGMVVDPGCMKCMDCVSVCPNDALYFGFDKPQIFGGRTQFLADRDAEAPTEGEPQVSACATHEPDQQTGSRELKFAARKIDDRKSTIENRKSASRYDFTLIEELAMAAVGLFALLAYRGLYGQIPLLLAMGMAAITSFLFIKFTHLLRHANVKLQNKQFKRGGALTPTGWGFATTATIILLLTVHSFAVQYEFWRGQRAFTAAAVGDEAWLPGATWWHKATAEQKASVEAAMNHFRRGQKISLMQTPAVLQDAVWLHLAKGDVAAAEDTVRKLLELIPEEAEPHRGLAGILRLTNRPAEAEIAYRRALEIDRTHDAARGELAGLLIAENRIDDAIVVVHEGESASQDAPRWRMQSATLLGERGVTELQRGQSQAGIQNLREALKLNPDLTQVRYNLAIALLSVPQVAEAIELLERVVKEKPEMTEAHYNLAVGIFMSGRPADAVPHAREALRLAPNDEQSREFLKLLETESGK